MDEYLKPTATIESTDPAVVEFAASHARAGERETAVALYYAVRDTVRYDPYQVDLTVDGMKASTTLRNRYGWCVNKAVLLAAAARARAIPARLGFGDVRNHLSTERLRQRLGTDVFYWHGYVELLIGGRWVKATPAFNIELTERFGLLPLEFDGQADSIYHPFDASGRRHMEYLAMRGPYADLPLQEIVAAFVRHYPGVWGGPDAARKGIEGDFDADVAREVSGPRR